ncbi:MAG: CARDB domain-containing protein [Candidatus Accumulibacter meliphilus]|uniref:CARDB domain-containing protein n=1 Tax=Candidatus Accumulibacter meliphilus TaxID=2211374 RepID=UPI002FC373A0
MIDGAADTAHDRPYAFTLRTPPATASKVPPLVLGSTVGLTVDGNGSTPYALHLEQPSVLAFDSLSSGADLWWQLLDPAGLLLFSRRMLDPATGTYASTVNHARYHSGELAAGDYTLLIRNFGGTPESCSFRVLALDDSPLLARDTPTAISTAPADGTQTFRFEARAGERYFLNVLDASSTSSSGAARAVAQWKLLDPLGRTVFQPSAMGVASVAVDHVDSATGQIVYRHGLRGVDQETPELLITGSYTLVIDGANTATKAAAPISFSLGLVPQASTQTRDDFRAKPAADLTVSSIIVAPTDELRTGQTIDLEWLLENRGSEASVGNWHERIVVRNLDSGRIVADVYVPYDASESANGALAAGDSRSRRHTLTLPADDSAAGRLRITVIADADNVIRESSVGGMNERNNARSIEIDVVRAPASELHIENLVFAADSAFEPGAEVWIAWDTVNRGNQAAAPGWSERLELLNLTTRELLASIVLDDLTSEEPLAVDASRSRSASLLWPSGSSAAGRFLLRVVAIASGSTDAAQRTQSAELIHLVGADLEIRNLRVLRTDDTDDTDIQAGGRVTIHWEDWNSGDSSTAGAFPERIVVTNLDSAQQLLDSSVTYDPLATTEGEPNGAIAPGEYRERSFSFRLPDGLRAVGTLEIRVSVDQDGSGLGVLFESSAAALPADAESNNSASVQLLAASTAYADLQVESFAAPATGISGEQISIDWQVANRGSADADSDWNDQLIISRDAVIGNGDDILVGSFRHSGGLRHGESYTGSATLTLPFIAQGPVFLALRTDADQEAIEPDTRADNSLSAAFALQSPFADMTVVEITAPALALSGGSADIRWSVRNDGNASSDQALWHDRVLLSSDTSLDASDIIVANLPHAGTLAPGESYLGAVTVTLPGALSGAYFVLVVSDADARLSERNRSNNRLAAALEVQLVPSVDLVVDALTLDPEGALQPGETVTVHWLTSNQGNRAAEEPWSERLELRNAETESLLATVDLASDGPLAAGASRSRSAQFTWPSGAAAAGRFLLRVIADAGGQLAEANPGGNAETNNSAELLRVTGPDLLPGNLRVEPADVGGIEAGATLTLAWEIRNEGDSATDAVFNERIRVRNIDADVVILDTHLAFDPLSTVDGQPAGPLQPGEPRQRHFNFTLPQGYQGSGRFVITLTTDQSQTGVGAVFEHNPQGDAEDNNSAGVTFYSASRDYPDLRVEAANAPPGGVGGELGEVSWSVANRGTVDADGGWNDQIILSTDALIGNGDDLVIGSVRHEGGLRVGESYTQSASVRVPLRSAGAYTLGIRTDSAREAEPDPAADNFSSALPFELITPIVDLTVVSVDAPSMARSGEEVSISWQVRNLGNATTDRAQWNDRLVLSADTNVSSDDLVVAGSLVHSGALGPGEDYRGQATLILPRDLDGDYFVLVETNANRRVNEGGRNSNNSAASAAALAIRLTPTPDLTVSDVLGPSALRPGDLASVSYTLSNSGAASSSGAWRDRIFLEDSAGMLREVASVFNSAVLAAGDSVTRSASFTLPTSLPDGEWRWLVKTDSDDSVYERGAENNNLARASDTLRVARVDLSVHVSDPAPLLSSGAVLHVEWQVRNAGGVALGSWSDQVFLAPTDGSAPAQRLAEIVRQGPLASGASYDAVADIVVPLDFSGAYDLIVVSDAGNAIGDGQRSNNRSTASLQIELSPYADLAVSAVSAPQTLIADPARLTVAWTVSNQGTGAGRFSSWSDRVLLSRDDILGNADDLLIGDYRHDGALAAGESYSRSEDIQLAARSSGRFRLFVVSDARSEVFENHAEANNIAHLEHPLDVMPVAYADLQIAR